MDELNINDINLNDLEQIPIPEGLEERLTAKIDEWEKAERVPRRLAFSKTLRYVSAAASITLVLGLGYYTFTRVHNDSATDICQAEQDTYQDPDIAQREAERALTLLAVNLNKGMSQLKKAQAISTKTEQTLNKQLKILE